MSIASREAKWMMFLSLCAGHSAPVQRMATPSSSRTMGEPHSGQVSGRRKGAAPSGRLLFTTSSTSGIISPALRTTTVSPILHVELVYEVLVVQRGVRHRCAREADRLDDRLGRQDARAPHLDDDIAHDALLLLRRILVSGSPTRGLGRAAQLHALGQGVYLDDRAVNVVGEISPVLAYTFNRCLAVFKAAADGIGYGVKAELAQGIQRFSVGRELAANGFLDVEYA